MEVPRWVASFHLEFQKVDEVLQQRICDRIELGLVAGQTSRFSLATLELLPVGRCH